VHVVFESKKAEESCTQGIRIFDEPFFIETKRYGKVIKI